MVFLPIRKFPWPASSQRFCDNGINGALCATRGERGIAVSKMAWLGTISWAQSPVLESCPLRPLPSSFFTSHSCPQLFSQGKRSRSPTQETFKTMDRTHVGQSTHCSDRETEDTEAESHPKPHDKQMAENSLECRYAPHLSLWLWNVRAERAFVAQVVQILSLLRRGNRVS